MRIVRKKRKGIKIEYNKTLLIVIVLLLIFFVAIIYFIIQTEKIGECKSDKDCVPSACCHADSCIPKEKAPNCSGIFCSAVCSGPLDCGAGRCGCVKGKCEVISKK